MVSGLPRDSGYLRTSSSSVVSRSYNKNVVDAAESGLRCGYMRIKEGNILTAMCDLPASGIEDGLQGIRLVHEPRRVPEDLGRLGGRSGGLGPHAGEDEGREQGGMG